MDRGLRIITIISLTGILLMIICLMKFHASPVDSALQVDLCQSDNVITITTNESAFYIFADKVSVDGETLDVVVVKRSVFLNEGEAQLKINYYTGINYLKISGYVTPISQIRKCN
jgi:hypothetical protein